ncbi:DNA-binding transcriptional LysR family regulator [Collimonas sp. PA-H2]|uniref:LysR family transcriptional regulator n=1 Tax=Collimonas sp. PA-H2 TaxID=1881062 RepID=UPI000BF83469|nr:LysR family transcriptional regulator [Collimonas sp. PA-H2]PFH07821.1 DNA-binding transcriptional LysR family regulator [Collimonas sp. PA-H2]
MRGNEFAEFNAFVAIAERESFVKAAAFLKVTPSALSQSMRQLETRLGVRLLHRTTRSVSLTEAGRQLLDHLRPALDGLARAAEAINDFRETPSGTVRLTAPRIATELLIAPRLAEFRTCYPEIVLDISVEDKFVDLAKHGFDAGIRLGELLAKDMIASRIGPDRRFAAVASRSYLAKHGVPHSPHDLQKHECIRIKRPTTGVNRPWGFMDKGHTLEISVAGHLLVNDANLALAAALSGAGVALLAEDHVRPYLQSGRLVEMLEDYSWSRAGFFLYYSSRRNMSASLHALVSFLREPLQGATSSHNGTIIGSMSKNEG